MPDRRDGNSTMLHFSREILWYAAQPRGGADSQHTLSSAALPHSEKEMTHLAHTRRSRSLRRAVLRARFSKRVRHQSVYCPAAQNAISIRSSLACASMFPRISSSSAGPGRKIRRSFSSHLHLQT